MPESWLNALDALRERAKTAHDDPEQLPAVTDVAILHLTAMDDPANPGTPIARACATDDTPASSGFCYGPTTPPTADPLASESVPTFFMAQARPPRGSPPPGTPATAPPATTPPTPAVTPIEDSGDATRPDWDGGSGWWWLNPWSYPGPRHGINWLCGSYAQESRSELLDWQAKLAKHCGGDLKALEELATLLRAWRSTPNRLWNFRLSYEGGGYCAAFLQNLCARLPADFREGKTALEVTPVWFRQGDPGVVAGIGLLLGGSPGHFALRVKFPDGFVVYLDNGWAGTGGIFTFMGGTKVPTPKRLLCGEIPTNPAAGEPGWPH